ncbi:hypothetical protein SPHINGOR109_30001 [Sphingorhabdus sp. 109]|nr:hypothetical protein SPHINGOR109_30001 [Sphingorhabdus sp. 109]
MGALLQKTSSPFSITTGSVAIRLRERCCYIATTPTRSLKRRGLSPFSLPWLNRTINKDAKQQGAGVRGLEVLECRDNAT